MCFIVALHGGGLTISESKVLNKAVCSANTTIKSAKFNGRYIPRPAKTNEQVAKAIVYCDGFGDIVLVHLLNIFDNEDITSRSDLIDTKVRQGWSKCCSLSGHVNGSELIKNFNKNESAREAYFGKGFKKFKLQSIKIGGEGTATTAKAIYLNPKGEMKSFQIGNYLKRDIFKNTNDCNYQSTAGQVLKDFGPFVYDPDNLLQGFQLKDLYLAINEWGYGSEAPSAWHYDSVVKAACLVSAKAEGELDSIEKGGGDAGSLCLEFGGFIHTYGSRDAMIFNGSHLHGPTVPAPLNIGKGISPCRFSFVTFLK